MVMMPQPWFNDRTSLCHLVLLTNFWLRREMPVEHLRIGVWEIGLDGSLTLHHCLGSSAIITIRQP